MVNIAKVWTEPEKPVIGKPFYLYVLVDWQRPFTKYMLVITPISYEPPVNFRISMVQHTWDSDLAKTTTAQFYYNVMPTYKFTVKIDLMDPRATKIYHSKTHTIYGVGGRSVNLLDLRDKYEMRADQKEIYVSYDWQAGQLGVLTAPHVEGKDLLENNKWHLLKPFQRYSDMAGKKFTFKYYIPDEILKELLLKAPGKKIRDVVSAGASVYYE